MSRRTAESNKLFLLRGIKNKSLFRKEKEQENGLLSNSRISLIKEKLMMITGKPSKGSI